MYMTYPMIKCELGQPNMNRFYSRDDTNKPTGQKLLLEVAIDCMPIHVHRYLTNGGFNSILTLPI